MIQEVGGKSPLAMLQEICRNIGSDITEEISSGKSPQITSSNQTIMSPRGHKRSASRSSAASTSPKTRRSSTQSHHSANSPQKPVNSTAHKSEVSPQLTAPSQRQVDLNDQLIAQYQMLYQKILYQNELEKIKLSMTPPATPTNPPASLYSSVSNFYPPGGLPPMSNFSFPPQAALSLSTPAIDFSRLSALFYERLEQFLPLRDNKFNPAPPHIPPAEPKLHQCNWVTANGFCGKSFYSNDDLMSHLRSHVCNITDSSPMAMPGLCRNQISDDLRQSMFTTSPPAFRYKPYNNIIPKPVPTLFL